MIMLISAISSNGCSSFRPARIAFLTSHKGIPHSDVVIMMDADGSELDELVSGTYIKPWNFPLCWSADRTRLLYIEGATRDREKWLSIVDSDGKSKHRILDISMKGVQGFSISPDGKTAILDYQDLAEVVRDGETNLEPYSPPSIISVNIESGKLTTLTNSDEINASYPVFSPNGKRIAFIGRTDDPETHTDLYIMNSDGTNLKRMTHHHGIMFYPGNVLYWSPDCRKVLYVMMNNFVDSETFTDLFMANVTSGEESNLTKTESETEMEPRWSPDGKLLAFTRLSGKYQTPSTIVMNAGGTHLKTVAKWFSSASWLPNSRRLIGMGQTEESIPAIITIDIDGVNTEILLPFSVIADNYSGMSYPMWLGE
jgi:Tol biopolymer transport system component